MAKIVESLEWKTDKFIYPWEEWFDGQARILVAGEDFTAKPVSMYNMTRTTARNMGIKIRTSRHGDEIWIQAIR